MRNLNKKDINISKSFGVLTLTSTQVRERYNKKNNTNIPQSSLYEVLKRLVDSKWLEKDVENKQVKYGLSLKGIKAFEMVKEIERIFK